MNELEVKKIKQEIVTSQQQALSLKVIDNITYTQAGELLSAHKSLKKRIEEYFSGVDGKSGMKPKAYATWKQICADEATEIAKLEPAIKYLNSEMVKWNLEQERIRKIQEEYLRAAALKREEEDRLDAALRAEEQGDREEAEAILEEPVFVPPPIVESSTPRIAGLAMKDNWDFEVVNELIIPRNYLKIDEIKIRGVARAMKNATNIPGIKAINRTKMSGVRK